MKVKKFMGDRKKMIYAFGAGAVVLASGAIGCKIGRELELSRLSKIFKGKNLKILTDVRKATKKHVRPNLCAQ